MGALNRATVAEVEEILAGDPGWWGDLCAVVAEEGQAGLRRIREERGWAWGALWRWIVADERRYADYMRALEAYVQDRALETVPLTDAATPETVGVVKLQVDARMRLAGKVDRARWGERVAVEGAPPALLDAALVGFAAGLLERMRPGLPAERVVEALPEPADDGMI